MLLLVCVFFVYAFFYISSLKVSYRDSQFWHLRTSASVICTNQHILRFNWEPNGALSHIFIALCDDLCCSISLTKAKQHKLVKFLYFYFYRKLSWATFQFIIHVICQPGMLSKHHIFVIHIISYLYGIRN